MISKLLLTTILVALCTSCFLDKESCDRMTEFTKEEDYQLITTKITKISVLGEKFRYTVQGRDLRTQKDTTVELYNYRWHDSFAFYWNTGDTLIKSKNSMVTEIHTTDTIYYMDWACGGEYLVNGLTQEEVIRTAHFKELKRKYYKKKYNRELSL